jgi:hypothetical protein
MSYAKPRPCRTADPEFGEFQGLSAESSSSAIDSNTRSELPAPATAAEAQVVALEKAKFQGASVGQPTEPCLASPQTPSASLCGRHAGTRCTKPVPTPSSRPIFSIPMPPLWSCLMTSSKDQHETLVKEGRGLGAP